MNTKFLFILLTTTNLYASSYLTYEAQGEDAVEESLDIVSNIFESTYLADISLFLKRIAKAESNYGQDPLTFRAGYFGGIWQVDKIAFEETKNRRAHKKIKSLHKAFEASEARQDAVVKTWDEVCWEDCKAPIYSSLAARFYLATIAAVVPKTLEEQAEYWKTFYNTSAGAGRPENFIRVNR